MTTTEAERFRRLMDLVGDAVERPPAEREAFLAGRCGEDPALLAEARALVAAADHSSLERVTAELHERVARAATAATAPVTHPDWIGPYEILDVLGEGGMGVVYRARQHEPIRRDVAVKVVRTGLAGPDTLARFVAERQALARLDHPHIAQILDAGTTREGMPYFAMEWVRGEPITGWCDRHHLDVPTRLRLFARACLAVHHAHQKAIIHRDLKPSNLLVTDVDGEAVPKVIDFGIARMMEQGDAPGQTAQGMLLGTLEYMSPEQAARSVGDIDVRSDVYSLGVILYELLTGTLPFPSEVLRGASPVEVQRLLCETDPPTPSTRVTAEGTRTIVGARGGSRTPSSGALRREIDWVVMKALEKDPARRYQSALALAEDLERLRRHEPVVAAPPSMRYRVGKFIQRHRTATIAGAVTLLALVGGAIAATVGLVQATRAREAALIETRKTQAVNQFLADMFASVEPDRARGTVVTVREVLDSTAVRLEREQPFADQPDVAASIRFAIGNSYREMGEYAAALPLLGRALDLWRAVLPADDNRIAQAVSGIGNAHWRRGDLDSALVYAESLLAIRARTSPRIDPRYSQAVHILGNSHADLGHAVVAESLYRVSVGIDSLVLANALRDSATGRWRIGVVRERLDTARDNLGTSLNNLGTVLVDQASYDEATTVFGQSLAIRHDYLSPDNPQIGGTLSNLGAALLRAGHLDAAVDTLERAAALNERVYGPTHVTTASTWLRLGEAYLRSARLADARRVLDRARQTYALRTGADSYRVGQVLLREGEVRIAGGAVARGFDDMARGWQMIHDDLGAEHPLTGAGAEAIAAQHDALGEHARAAAWRARVPS